MRRVLVAFLLWLPIACGQSVFVNEIHYDNTGTDTGEAIEIAGPAGADVSGWRIVRYNGSVPDAGVVYTAPAATETFAAGTVIPNSTGTGFGFLVIQYPTDGLQNGANDGFALVDAGNRVVQFLCYEGVMTAGGTAPTPENPAAGMTCTDIGVAQLGTSAVGQSLQLTGAGSAYTDFRWAGAAANTFGAANNGQTFTALPSLTLEDVSRQEGNAGTTPFAFTVRLTSASPAEVSFIYFTADGSATAADGDYETTGLNLTMGRIAAGQTSTTITVLVNGDTKPEFDETFTVRLLGAVGATVVRGTATGTILNDDGPPPCESTHAISQVQGPTSTSPIVGRVVVVDGVVTANKFNGFFVQEPDADSDGNPETSEAIFVFTNNANGPAVGSLVCVTGTVTEFATSFSTLTQLTNARTQVMRGGVPLPAPIVLTSEFPHPDGGLDQLERWESMRITAPAFTAASGTTESNFENAAFYAVVQGMLSPFREPGIQAPRGVPSGSTKTIPPIPLFDSNPELVRIDLRGQNQASGPAVTAGQTVRNVVGVLDFNSRGFEIAQDVGVSAEISGPAQYRTVPAATANEITMGHMGLRNYTGAAAQQAKAVRVVRDVLRYPDLLGVTEVSTPAALEGLRDALNAGDSGLRYEAFLGTTGGSQNVGFLVKTSRISITTVPQQILEASMFVDPADGISKRLHDRAPLLLQARAGDFTFTAVMVHLRSLIDVESEVPASLQNNVTEGQRTRMKRRAAAEDLARYLQQRQLADPDERIFVMGDFNAFPFNDGYVDVLGTITGDPVAEHDVVEASGDLVNPNFVNLVATAKVAEEERYSYIFDGSRQVLDHILASQNAAGFVSRLVYARVNAWFPEQLASESTRPERLSDHDPALIYVTVR
ncbi:MAG: endonuclease/exonuclease/phosphatase family protein [Bryobacterales bacterium]|nr:endonuclease/exonuclease/phosphatase family protein [Bryobacterales bacterium]